jgi:chromosomal replication initiator protein
MLKLLMKEKIWQNFLSEIQLLITPFQFSTWFKNARISEITENSVTISVTNSFVKEWLEKKYQKIILKTFKKFLPEIKEVKFEIRKNPNPVIESTFQKKLEILKRKQETNLNPKYTFSNFVVGNFNELSYAAATAVCENPGKIYNPFFVFSGVGLGKTHLLQAIGNKILELKENFQIRYFQTQNFVSKIIQAIKEKKIDEFRKNLEEIDVLIVDDVHFLAGKERTQEEFFYLFNILYEKNKQIVLSSDRPPREIPTLTERLKSRFEGGILVDIVPPEYESRLAILKMKAQEKNFEVEDKVLEFIAQNFKRNIRELEGALNYIYCRFKDRERSADKIILSLQKFLKEPKKVVNYKTVIKEVVDFYGITEKELLSNNRRKDLVKARQIASFLIREELNCSFVSIAKIFGGKDHTTIMYGYQKILKEKEKNEKLRQEIEYLKDRIFS